MLRRWLIVSAVFATVFFLLGNRTDPLLWIYLATMLGLLLYALWGLDPDLARERFNPPTSGADRLSLAWVRAIALAHILVGLADSSYGWTHIPVPFRVIGIAGFAICFLVVVRAMRANRFFSAVVRIQTDRGHRVVDSGPYRVVRHPGYAGMIALVPLSGVAFGSWLSVGVALVYSALIVRRVLFEDRFLRQYLPGYDEYAHRVAYRLIPHVW